jgi:hypothetical protein
MSRHEHFLTKKKVKESRLMDIFVFMLRRILICKLEKLTSDLSSLDGTIINDEDRKYLCFTWDSSPEAGT